MFVPAVVADIWMENINSIHLIDLATLKGDEDYQLISYPEIVAVLNAMEQDRSIQPELRVPDESIGVQPSSRNLYGVPVEIRDARTMEDLINAMQREEYKMKQGQQQNKKGEKK